jgi:hypothetical protein
MTFTSPIKFNKKGYSQIIYTHDHSKRYRIIKNPSISTRIYYLSLRKSQQITVTLYPWD